MFCWGTLTRRNVWPWSEAEQSGHFPLAPPFRCRVISLLLTYILLAPLYWKCGSLHWQQARTASLVSVPTGCHLCLHNSIFKLGESSGLPLSQYLHLKSQDFLSVDWLRWHSTWPLEWNTLLEGYVCMPTPRIRSQVQVRFDRNHITWVCVRRRGILGAHYLFSCFDI